VRRNQPIEIELDGHPIDDSSFARDHHSQSDAPIARCVADAPTSTRDSSRDWMNAGGHNSARSRWL
jgi:hypothetical protein